MEHMDGYSIVYKGYSKRIQNLKKTSTIFLICNGFSPWDNQFFNKTPKTNFLNHLLCDSREETSCLKCKVVGPRVYVYVMHFLEYKAWVLNLYKEKIIFKINQH